MDNNTNINGWDEVDGFTKDTNPDEIKETVDEIKETVDETVNTSEETVDETVNASEETVNDNIENHADEHVYDNDHPYSYRLNNDNYSQYDNGNRGFAGYDYPGNHQYHERDNVRYGESVKYSYGPSDTKKKKKVWPAVLAVILVAALGFGAWGIGTALSRNGSRVNTETNMNNRPDRYNTDQSRNNQNPTFESEDTAKPSKDVSLIKGGENSIQAADSSGNKVNITDVSQVVENVMPTLVAITDNLEVTRAYNPYNYFFGFGRDYGQGGKSDSYETVASGSGVIIGESDEELLIVTNNHVINNSGDYTSYTVSSSGLTVQFVDGTTANASVKGTDSDNDLAVIAVKLSEISDETRNEIRIAQIGSSDDIKIGTGVICIGNAMGYGQSVTTGIISAKDRAVTIDKTTRYLLQTDAAINPGNSGGGMFNAEGALIGINSAKYSDTDVEGMCFAIPISSVEDIITELMNKVTVPEEEQGYLGINGETVPSTYINNYGYPAGVSVTRIQANSPADKAGLQLYDIITGVNGKSVSSMDELKAEVNSYAAGTEIEITLMRPEGREFTEITLKATLVKYSEISATTNTTKA